MLIVIISFTQTQSYHFFLSFLILVGSSLSLLAAVSLLYIHILRAYICFLILYRSSTKILIPSKCYEFFMRHNKRAFTRIRSQILCIIYVYRMKEAKEWKREREREKEWKNNNRSICTEPTGKDIAQERDEHEASIECYTIFGFFKRRR